MTGQVIALVLLATALPLWSGATVPSTRLAALSGRVRGRRVWWRSRGRVRCLPAVLATALGLSCCVAVGPVPAVVVAAVSWWAARRLTLTPTGRSGPVDELALAAGWDLLAACLRSGLPVPTAIRAVADGLPLDAREALRATADQLALGADSTSAWQQALACSSTAELARGARRSARSGAALAGVARALAVDLRAGALDHADARAERAAVLITAPLGLCFLPAFVCLGIVPVVVGLATQLSIT